MNTADNIPAKNPPDGGTAIQYFVMGNSKIVIKEHFMDGGRPLDDILEKVILNAEKHPKTA